jgi:hypothetical protein
MVDNDRRERDGLTTPKQCKLSNHHKARHPYAAILVVIADKHLVNRTERRMEKPLGSIHGSNKSLETGNETHTGRDNRLTITKTLD